jgi:hypothetical protein
MLEDVKVLTDRAVSFPCMKRAWSHVILCPTTPSVLLTCPLFYCWPCRSSAQKRIPGGLRMPANLIDPVVYATYLANLVPAKVSTHRPHSDVICGFLERANLPDEVVAFAACVLDALSKRFHGIWREALEPAEFERDLKNFLRNDTRRTAHVSPDLIVLAALSLAHGFLIDRLRSARHWSVKEGGGLFTVREIEATKRAMLEDSDYGLFRISNEMVEGMLATMRKAKTAAVSKHDRRRTLSIILTGAATWNHGQQTPEPSP